ncbi:MAG: radical SAM protein [Mariprofundaceae bacterium]|nr:radical SAM protein [Mariprofundaceae bacterium]
MAGLPCTFIRLAGCPLQCVYCDTPQAIPLDSGENQDLTRLLEELHPVQTPVVLVTGGEPLAQKNCTQLLQALLPIYQHVQLETSGAYDISIVPDDVAVILDIKTPASGECARNRWQNMEILRPNTEIKFVLMDEGDYTWAKEIIQKYDLSRYTLLMSCVWQALDPQDLAAWIVRDQLAVRLQLQLHKYIWGAKATGV